MDKTIIILLALVAVFFYLNTLSTEPPSQNEIQTLDYAKTKEQLRTDFPYPQISRGFKKLGSQIITKPLNNIQDLLPPKQNLSIIRDTSDTMGKKRIYLPDYYRKDRLGENDIGSEELRPFINDAEESEQSWTDENVSSHPKFYTSDIQNELTNVGMFFDKNNQYHDKTSSNTDVLVSDRCYKNKTGDVFCEDKTRLQNIPPSLISDVNRCYVLNNIGIHKDIHSKVGFANEFDVEKINGDHVGVWSYSDDRPIHGGVFYNEVNASKKSNEEYGNSLEPIVSSCNA